MKEGAAKGDVLDSTIKLEVIADVVSLVESTRTADYSAKTAVADIIDKGSSASPRSARVCHDASGVGETR